MLGRPKERAQHRVAKLLLTLLLLAALATLIYLSINKSVSSDGVVKLLGALGVFFALQFQKSA